MQEKKKIKYYTALVNYIKMTEDNLDNYRSQDLDEQDLKDLRESEKDMIGFYRRLIIDLTVEPLDLFKFFYELKIIQTDDKIIQATVNKLWVTHHSDKRRLQKEEAKKFVQLAFDDFGIVE